MRRHPHAAHAILRGVLRRFFPAILAVAAVAPAPAAAAAAEPTQAPPEVRGTWLTTTANDALRTPENTRRTMERLRAIGLNTVYVEVWKNGYTQFPSRTLHELVGVDRHPSLRPKTPADLPRDLLGESLAAAHDHGLTYIAWFEYGFMAAFKETDNELRRLKRDWLSEDIHGNTVAPNGFVWLNPLRPEVRRFLIDIVLEGVNNYDIDGVQLDDRIAWPHFTMGYDAFTREQYAREHDGRQPPANPRDPGWLRWRADKINEFSLEFVRAVRAARPELIISVSPAPFPWSYENYSADWPAWMRQGDRPADRWDECIPQCYRMDYDAFARSWREQIPHAGERVGDLLAGIRVVGDGPDLTWDDLRRSIELTRETGAGGHVLWFSKGVFLYERELTAFYDVASRGPAPRPRPRTAAPEKP